jgi:ABC-type glutathione transport system ATPase component
MAKVNQQEFLVVTPESLKETFPKLSKEDIDFLTPAQKILSRDETEIGIKKYNFLKEKQKGFNNYNFLNPTLEPKNLTELELVQIKKYDEDRIVLDETAKINQAEYLKIVCEGKKRPIDITEGIKVNISNLYHGFIQAFKVMNNKEYELTEDSILNIKAIIKYFANDHTFFECERLIKKIGNRNLDPSFEKGILIVGDFGNGKSTIMQTMEYLIDHNYKIAIEKKWDNIREWNNMRFKVKACRTIASEYEFLKKEDSKQDFLNKYTMFNYCFDDITKEQIASNYGLKNVIQIILENRYDDIFFKIKEDKKINKTHGTLNYHKDYPGDLKLAIQSLGVKYEPHMYDRVLELFNIIEFKGKSFRK